MGHYRCVFSDPKGRTIVNVDAGDALAALADARCRVVLERICHRVEVWHANSIVLSSCSVDADISASPLAIDARAM